jgi:hypothetical protein
LKQHLLRHDHKAYDIKDFKDSYGNPYVNIYNKFSVLEALNIGNGIKKKINSKLKKKNIINLIKLINLATKV